MKPFYAVFDTNVLVSALMSKRADSPTVTLLDMVFDGRIVLLYNSDIMAEYMDVLRRSKFSFDETRIAAVMAAVQAGISLDATLSEDYFPDPDDRVFYEVALSKDGSYLVTGNQKHFPASPIVVTPAEMLRLIEEV